MGMLELCWSCSKCSLIWQSAGMVSFNCQSVLLEWNHSVTANIVGKHQNQRDFLCGPDVSLSLTCQKIIRHTNLTNHSCCCYCWFKFKLSRQQGPYNQKQMDMALVEELMWLVFMWSGHTIAPHVAMRQYPARWDLSITVFWDISVQ